MVRITCVNKASGHHYDQHEAIYRFGWVADGSGNRGYSTRDEMIGFLEGNGLAYTRDSAGRVAWLIVVSREGRKYVKTVADGVISDNLLALGECPLV